jgi:DNA-directed RNA polymerase specialized sigma24 family protein
MYKTGADCLALTRKGPVFAFKAELHKMPSTPLITDLRQVNLEALVRRCVQETELFFRRQEHDPQYCFELFRRALCENDEAAWGWVYAQYHGLVAGWVRSNPEFERCGEEIQDIINRAFERMWAACIPEKFARFQDLRALLAYLKMCVHSAIMDAVRKTGPPPLELPGWLANSDHSSPDTSSEGGLLAQERSRELWRLINARLRDEKERAVVHGLFVLGLKPRAIFTQFPGLFGDTQEIYRIRQIVLERLSRDPNLKIFLGEDT